MITVDFKTYGKKINRAHIFILYINPFYTSRVLRIHTLSYAFMEYISLEELINIIKDD